MSRDVNIIIINGPPGVGKDTFIECYKGIRNRKCKSHVVFNISSVDKVKEIAMSMGWDGEKDAKSRDFLSAIKDAWVQYNQGPTNYMIKQIRTIVYDVGSKYENIDITIFLHIRESDQIQLMSNTLRSESDLSGFNIITLLIDRNIEDKRGKIKNHSDNNVYDYWYDVYIDNNGTIFDLFQSARIIYGGIGDGENYEGTGNIAERQ